MADKLSHYRKLLSDDIKNNVLDEFRVCIANHDVNKAVQVVSKAAESMKSKNVNNVNMDGKPKKRRVVAKWWDNECELAKAKKLSYLRNYRRRNSQQSLSLYLETKKSFKALCRSKMHKYSTEIYKDLHQATKCNNRVWN